MGRRGNGGGGGGGGGKICGKLYNTEICNNSITNNLDIHITKLQFSFWSVSILNLHQQ